jgi:hypothetical protein
MLDKMLTSVLSWHILMVKWREVDESGEFDEIQ